MEESEQDLLTLAAIHSAGYFIADTIDIFIDYTNEKRKVYVFHHLVAILGISTVYWDFFLCLYGIWALELGGVVHHIRHATKVFSNSRPILLAGEAIYHVVYIFSRLSLFINTTIGVFQWMDSRFKILDVVCFVSVYVLIVQNTIWWWHNVKTLWTKPLEGSHGSAEEEHMGDRRKQM